MKRKNDKNPKKGSRKNREQKKAEKPVAKRAPKKPSKLKAIKHSDIEELTIDKSIKPIIIKGKAATQPKRAKKELRRVAKSGGFTAWDGKTGKTFATKKEADDYAAEMSKQLGEKIEVTKTDRQVTHTFRAESEDEKK